MFSAQFVVIMRVCLYLLVARCAWAQGTYHPRPTTSCTLCHALPRPGGRNIAASGAGFKLASYRLLLRGSQTLFSRY